MTPDSRRGSFHMPGRDPGCAHHDNRKHQRVGATFTVVPCCRRRSAWAGDALHHWDDRKGRPYAQNTAILS